MSDNNPTPTPIPVTTTTHTSADEWKGMTLDELRLKRMKALVKREVGRERINHVMGGMRSQVANNGVRGLLFDNKTISGLKTADYMLLGWKATRMIMKLWRKMK